MISVTFIHLEIKRFFVTLCNRLWTSALQVIKV